MSPDQVMSVGIAALLIVSVIAVGAVPAVAERTTAGANFDVEITEATEVVAGGDAAVVKATVTNTGDSTDSQQIHLKNPNHDIVDSVKSPALTLAPGESKTVTLTWQTTEASQSGDVSVQSDNDIEDRYIEVRDGPSYELSTNVTVESNDQVSVSLDITNTGDMAGSTSAWIAVDGVKQDTQQISLQPSESTQVELVWSTAGTAAGEWDITIGAGDTSVSRTVTITDDSDDSDGDTSSDSTDPLVMERSNALIDGTTANVSGHDVTRVEFASPVDGQITADQLHRLPDGTESVDDAIGIYRIGVPETASEMAGSVTITFDVARLDGAAPESLLIKHWNGSAWTGLETRVSLVNGTVTLTALTEQFSLFAVTTGNEPATSTPTETATATATASETPTQTERETATETKTPPQGTTMQTETDTPGFGVVVALIAVVLGALLSTRFQRE